MGIPKNLRWLALCGLLLLVALSALAALVPAFEIPWWTVDGGGVESLVGGNYSLSTTAGQPDAGKLTGGAYVLEGGYWHRVLGPTGSNVWRRYP